MSLHLRHYECTDSLTLSQELYQGLVVYSAFAARWWKTGRWLAGGKLGGGCWNLALGLYAGPRLSIVDLFSASGSYNCGLPIRERPGNSCRPWLLGQAGGG